MIHKIIYADPPWSYKDKASSGNRGASHKYDVMTIDDIKAMPITNLAASDCALFMWATFPLYQEALDTIKAWGFTYKTVAFIWVKTNRKAGTDFMGMGNWTRANAEACLIATRGSIKRQSASVRQIIDAPEPEVIRAPMVGHSVKPPEIRDRIVELCGDLPRCELFARDKADYWDAWGNQAPECSKYIDGILNANNK